MKKSGFTLIEILVVVTIIGILSVVAITSFSSINSKIKDVKKKADIDALANAYELKYSPKDRVYPKLSEDDFAQKIIPSDTSFSGLIETDTAPSFKICVTLSDNTSYCKDSIHEGGAITSIPKGESKGKLPALPTPALTTPISTPPPSPQSGGNPPPAGNPVVCSSFAVTDTNAPINTYNTGEKLTIVPNLNWDNISKVDVRVYKYPNPLAPPDNPFSENNWNMLGTITRTPVYECIRWGYDSDDKEECQEYGTKILDYTISGPEKVCTKREAGQSCSIYSAAVSWYASDYPGIYYLGMEAYNTKGQKVAGWNSGNTQGCTQAQDIQAWSASGLSGGSCKTDRAVYPTNVVAAISGNNVLVQWQVQNSAGKDLDQASVYLSDQAGFTPKSQNRITRLKSNTNTAQDIILDGNIQNKPAFYKLTAFNLKGESAPSSQTSVTAMSADTCSMGNNTVAEPTNVSINNDTIKWSYYRFIAQEGGKTKTAQISGWKIINITNGMVFDVKNDEVQTKIVTNKDFLFDRRDVSWQMPTKIAGNYSVSGYLNWCDGRVYFSGTNYSSNNMESSSTTPTSAPTNIPGAPQASLSSNNNNPVNLTWTDTNTNESGFHIYKSFDPIDLNLSSKNTNTNSSKQWSYFKNVATGKHYLAVKVSNRCGNGWSNIIPIDMPAGGVLGTNTNLFNQLKTIFQSIFGNQGS